MESLTRGTLKHTDAGQHTKIYTDDTLSFIQMLGRTGDSRALCSMTSFPSHSGLRTLDS